MARWLYDDPGERTYVDIDLLVGPDQFEIAQHGLAELGFQLWPASGQARRGAQLGADGRPEEFAVAEEWVRGETLHEVVDLHRTLYLLSASPALVWQRLSADTSQMEVAHARVEVPSPAVSALIIGLHAAKHGATLPAPLRDLQLALDRVDAGTWREAAALAKELGGGAAFAVGLRLDPRGRELADQLRLPAGPRFVRLLASSPPATALGVERIIAARGVRARLRLAGRALAPSPASMRNVHPLARQGGWGLAVAYLWRPFYLAARLPRGVHAWLRVARAPSDQEPGR